MHTIYIYIYIFYFYLVDSEYIDKPSLFKAKRIFPREDLEPSEARSQEASVGRRKRVSSSHCCRPRGGGDAVARGGNGACRSGSTRRCRKGTSKKRGGSVSSCGGGCFFCGLDFFLAGKKDVGSDKNINTQLELEGGTV